MDSKLFKTKILALITAIALFAGVGLVYGFTTDKVVSNPKTAPTKLVNTEFRYTGANTNIGSITDVNNWDISSGSETCELGDLPCVVAPNSPSITTEAQLVSYLSSLSSGAAIAFVEDNTTKHRD
jgi:hypothetical protein